MKKETVQYKDMRDHIEVVYVPKNWVGYDNPQIRITLNRKVTKDQERALIIEIESALFRWGALTQFAFKAEIKP